MHRSSSLPALFIGCAAFGGLPLLAQTQLSLPTHADSVDGHHKHPLPFGMPGFRTQILVDAAAIAPNGALLNGIAFRSDRPSAPLAAQQVPNVTVSLSQTTAVVGAMSDTFATNVTGTPTVVFQGTVNLPAASAGLAGPQPWDVVVTFAAPFLFTTGGGNLLIDITGNNPPAIIAGYYLDAVQGGGSASPFGTNGVEPADSLRLHALSSLANLEMDARRYTLGNTIQFASFRGLNASPGVIALGTAPQPTPIDLTPLGAPTNWLYVDPIVVAAHTWSQNWFGWAALFPVLVPVNPQLIGATLYGQSLVFEPAANALGVVLSNAVEVRIGDPAEQLPLQQCDAWDPAAATGYLVDFSSPLAPFERGSVPIRLDGVFF